jgi:hypothetical protein
MHFEISEELANKILQYLGQRPFVEVYQLIGQLQQLKKCECVNKENEKG